MFIIISYFLRDCNGKNEVFNIFHRKLNFLPHSGKRQTAIPPLDRIPIVYYNIRNGSPALTNFVSRKSDGPEGIHKRETAKRMDTIPMALKNNYDSQENKLLIARISDGARLCEKRNCPVYTDFLSPAQQGLAEKTAKLYPFLDFQLWGGYENAERKMGVFIPKRVTEPEYPITVLALMTRGEYPAHPEILGALTGLGVRREKIGDILASSLPPKLICNTSVAPFLIENFTKAGRKTFRLQPCEIGHVPEAEHEIKTFTVPSLRLDCVAAEGFGMARTKMTELIKKGGAFLNWIETDSPSAPVQEGDTVSLRGFGRLTVSEIGGHSRKDRIFVTVKRYAGRK